MSPNRSVGDDPDARVEVERYSDLAAKKRGLTNRQVDRIATAFEDGVSAALVIEAWCDDIDLSDEEGVRHVYFGECVRESDTGKAWRFASGGKAVWVPKSTTTLFLNDLDSRSLDSPQSGLGDFASAGGRL